MRDPRPPGRDWREWRRLRAWELKQQSWQQCAIAAALGVTEGAVSQWLRRAREGGGVAALKHRSPPGPSPKLTPEQLAQLPSLGTRGVLVEWAAHAALRLVPTSRQQAQRPRSSRPPEVRLPSLSAYVH